MKKTIIGLFLAAVALICIAATPSFQSFVTSQFGTSSTLVWIKDGAAMTNDTHYGTVTINHPGTLFVGDVNHATQINSNTITTDVLSAGSGNTVTNNDNFNINGNLNAGSQNIVSGAQSTALGTDMRVSGDYNVGVNDANVLSGTSGFATGYNNTNTGSMSTVGGEESAVTGHHSRVFGYGSIGAGNYSDVSGTSAFSTANNTYIWNDGSGNKTNSTANSFMVNATGGINLLGGVITGNGSGLTALNADNISSGTLANARLPLLFTNFVVYGSNASAITLHGGFSSTNDTSGSTSVLTNASLVLSNGANGNTISLTNGIVTASFSGSGANLTALNADNIGSGTVAIARGGVGAAFTPANGKILIGNTNGGWTLASLTGTANRITVTEGSGTITLSGPQDLATASSPTFAALTLSSSFTGNTVAPLVVQNGSGTPAIDSAEAIDFQAARGSGTQSIYGRIKTTTTDTNNTTYSGRMDFLIRSNGSLITPLSLYPDGSAGANSLIVSNGLFKVSALGALNCRMTVLDKATSYTTIIGESLTIFDNFGATAEVTITLPAGAVGMTRTFYVEDTDGLKIVANGAEQIRVGASISTATTGDVKSSTIGNSITITWTGRYWAATSVVGTWTVD